MAHAAVINLILILEVVLDIMLWTANLQKKIESVAKMQIILRNCWEIAGFAVILQLIF